jgi:hypothetical protein
MPLPHTYYVPHPSSVLGCRQKCVSRKAIRKKTAFNNVRVPNLTHQGRKFFDVTEEGMEMGKFLTYVIDSMQVRLEDKSFCLLRHVEW